MTNTLTLLKDHTGSDKPKVMGTEYVVDAMINVTDFDDTQGSLTAQLDGTANTIVITAGTFDSGLYVAGQNLIIAGSAHENGTVTIVSIDATAAMTLSAVSESETDDGSVILSTDQVIIPYLDFGLRSVSQVMILGQENRLLNWHVHLGATGESLIPGKLVLSCKTASTGAVLAGDAGTLRVRLVGQI